MKQRTTLNTNIIVAGKRSAPNIKDGIVTLNDDTKVTHHPNESEKDKSSAMLSRVGPLGWLSSTVVGGGTGRFSSRRGRSVFGIMRARGRFGGARGKSFMKGSVEILMWMLLAVKVEPDGARIDTYVGHWRCLRASSLEQQTAHGYMHRNPARSSIAN